MVVVVVAGVGVAGAGGRVRELDGAQEVCCSGGPLGVLMSLCVRVCVRRTVSEAGCLPWARCGLLRPCCIDSDLGVGVRVSYSLGPQYLQGLPEGEMQ